LAKNQKSKFWPEIWAKNLNFVEKWKSCSKIEIWAKPKFWTKIEILSINRNFDEQKNFAQIIANLPTKSK